MPVVQDGTLQVVEAVVPDQVVGRPAQPLKLGQNGAQGVVALVLEMEGGNRGEWERNGRETGGIDRGTGDTVCDISV